MYNNLVVGMLAHVDAGKTTLSEGLLFVGGALRRLGRVDHKDAFLDTDAMERRRKTGSMRAVFLFHSGRMTRPFKRRSPSVTRRC
ncbi:MAG: GTP-binding protein [Firmicutes bacterium]|nr:GTP-binding protein [Bacillota bacterium]